MVATLSRAFSRRSPLTCGRSFKRPGWPIWPRDLCLGYRAVAGSSSACGRCEQSIVAPPGMVDRVLAEYKHGGVTQELLTKTARAGACSAGCWRPGSPTSRARDRSCQGSDRRGRPHRQPRSRAFSDRRSAPSRRCRPLLGLFGTVVGMIEIFGSQTAAGSNPDSARARDLGGAPQHRAGAASSRIPSMISLSPFPRQGRRPHPRDGTAGDQAWSSWRTASAADAKATVNFRGMPSAGRTTEINFIPLIDRAARHS
mgnify:CR=1 FL=1